MPFTFSHPALIIPLLRQRQRYPWISATGLIAGSIAPDFEKFFRLQLSSHHSHTFNSIFYFSCPVALGLAFVFHLLVRRPLLAHLPAPLYGRLAKFTNFNWLGFVRQHPFGVMASIVVGAALHLFWDSFTHQNALMAHVVPGLDGVVWASGREMPVSEIVALLSSAGGVVVIAWAVWKMPVRFWGPAPSAAAVGRYWGIAATVAFVLLMQWVLMTHPRWLSIAISAISAAMIGILVASIYTGWRNIAHGRRL
jgi:hypothetical protein